MAINCKWDFQIQLTKYGSGRSNILHRTDQAQCHHVDFDVLRRHMEYTTQHTCTFQAHLLYWRVCLLMESMLHYSDVTMGAMASQITSIAIVYSTVYSGADERKHQSFASLAFFRGIHRWPGNSAHKGPVKPQSHRIVWFCNRTIVGEFIRQRLVARVFYDLIMQSLVAIVFRMVVRLIVRHAVRLYWTEKYQSQDQSLIIARLVVMICDWSYD